MMGLIISESGLAGWDSFAKITTKSKCEPDMIMLFGHGPSVFHLCFLPRSSPDSSPSACLSSEKVADECEEALGVAPATNSQFANAGNRFKSIRDLAQLKNTPQNMNCITFQLIREDESMSISALKMHVL
jgi:hypothetical protein